jgi:hypothetical protein
MAPLDACTAVCCATGVLIAHSVRNVGAMRDVVNHECAACRRVSHSSGNPVTIVQRTSERTSATHERAARACRMSVPHERAARAIASRVLSAASYRAHHFLPVSTRHPRIGAMDIGLVVGLALLIVWAVATFVYGAPGWIHLLLSVGLFLVIWRIAAQSASGRKKG